MLDNLPPALRHALIVLGGAFGSVVVAAIVGAKGVTGVDWPTTLLEAVNYGALSVALSLSALYLTPLTRQYGIGEKK